MDVTCSNCGTANPAGAKFCGVCGRTLAVVCAVCGTANEPRFQFCVSCGSALQAGGPGASALPPAVPGPATREAPISERRLVSILFADLVGFTTLSESRDPDEVRDLLSRYFDSCSQLIGRYGGTVEKFIGDAVMAVWGTPVAQEDDAERAVRAALDLTAAVAALGEQIGADLKARAGRAHRRGLGHPRRRGAGHGRRRPRQHGLAGPVRRSGRRVYVDDATRRVDRGGHRVRGRRRPRAQGQGRTGPALLRPPGHRVPARSASSRRGSRRPSSAGIASCVWSRICSTPRPRSAAPNSFW